MSPIFRIHLNDQFNADLLHLEDAGMPDKHGLFELDIVLFGHEFLITGGLLLRRIPRREYMADRITDRIMAIEKQIKLMEIAATTDDDWKTIHLEQDKLNRLKQRLAKLRGLPLETYI